MTRAIYPGSFDPVTLGHLDIIGRSARLFDELIIGVLNNDAKKQSLFTPDERVELIRKCTKDFPNVKVEAFDGLLVEFAKIRQANIIVRGLRAVTDFEYELQMSQTNRVMNQDVDTLFLTTSLEYAYLSSSIVKEVAKNGGDIHAFVPDLVADAVYERIGNDKQARYYNLRED